MGGMPDGWGQMQRRPTQLSCWVGSYIGSPRHWLTKVMCDTSWAESRLTHDKGIQSSLSGHPKADYYTREMAKQDKAKLEKFLRKKGVPSLDHSTFIIGKGKVLKPRKKGKEKRDSTKS